MNTETSYLTGRARFFAAIHRGAEIWPGLLICTLIALATAFISHHYGGAILLYALLFGMALHFLNDDVRVRVGIEFTARTLLRFGVALLGARITADQVAALGLGTVILVIAAVAGTIMAARAIAGLLGVSRDFGLLSGGATAICGVSAAMALSAVMPRSKDNENFLILTVIGVTTFSTIAMILYPVIVALLGLNNLQAGIFLGGTIHDVAQVVGAGYTVSTETGEAATVVKLMRVALLVPVVLVFSLLFRAKGTADGKRPMPAFPPFLVGFVALVVINSAGVIPLSVAEGLYTTSRWCLVVSIAALGVKTSLQKILTVGWRPVLLITAETIFIALFVLIGVFVLGLT